MDSTLRRAISADLAELAISFLDPIVLFLNPYFQFLNLNPLLSHLIFIPILIFTFDIFSQASDFLFMAPLLQSGLPVDNISDPLVE